MATDKSQSDKRAPVRLPTESRPPSYLSQENPFMAAQRREQEQEGHRHYAKVNARARQLNDQPAPEGELQNNIRAHPELDKQLYDGVDTNLNPEPPLNSDARREYDNAQREQQLDKQLRLGNMPKMGSSPKPEFR